ncbi:MAG: hypothetical protein ACC631_05170, partial [Halocynthiibacter sp.]
ANLPVYEEILANIPVYADPNDRYSWSKAIKEMAEQKKTGIVTGRITSGELTLPTWADHFNLVLSIT